MLNHLTFMNNNLSSPYPVGSMNKRKDEWVKFESKCLLINVGRRQWIPAIVFIENLPLWFFFFCLQKKLWEGGGNLVVERGCYEMCHQQTGITMGQVYINVYCCQGDLCNQATDLCPHVAGLVGIVVVAMWSVWRWCPARIKTFRVDHLIVDHSQIWVQIRPGCDGYCIGALLVDPKAPSHDPLTHWPLEDAAEYYFQTYLADWNHEYIRGLHDPLIISPLQFM